MLVAITGANGFVGSHLGEFLVKNKVSVKGLVRAGREDAVKYFGGEACTVDYFDFESLMEALDGVSVVYHFAGTTQQTKSVTFEKDYLQLGKNVIEACKNSGVRKIIINSGLGVEKYGKSNKYFCKQWLFRCRIRNRIRSSKV